jgi:hypothetical protein
MCILWPEVNVLFQFFTAFLFFQGGPTCLPGEPCGGDGPLSSGEKLIFALLMTPITAVFGALLMRVVRRIYAAKS